MTLSIYHDAGFFSCCSVKIIRIVDYFNRNGRLPELIDSSNLWNKYKDVGDIDVTNYFFRDPNEINQDLENVECVDRQFYNYRILDLKIINKFIKKYFSPSSFVENYENFLLSKYKINLNKTISVFYRAHDKHTETIIPSYQEMFEKIKEIKDKNKEHRLIVQSADPDFCNFIKNNYPDSIIFEEIMKFDKSTGGELGTHVPEGKRKEQAAIFLAIILIISKSSEVILNSGNIGMWIAFFRGQIEGIHQFLHNHGEKQIWFDN
jgi:hypothetical protein